jgi:tetratricopeptide (TPR) repeat protein
MGDLYSSTGNWEEAIDAYSKVIAERSDDAGLLSKRAVAYAALDQWEQADADWNLAMELRPGDAELTQRRLDALTRGERWQDIASEYDRQLEALPEGRASHNVRPALLAKILRRKDPVFEALQKLRPNDSLLQVTLARDAVVRNDWQQSADGYPRELDPISDPNEWYETAAALLLTDQHSEYNAFFQSVVEQRSDQADDPMVAYALARTAAISDEEIVPWSQVVKWGELAAADTPMKPWFGHVAGLAHYRAGDQDKALQWLNQSAATTWHPELNRIGLCLVHASRGDRQKARGYLQQVREWLAAQEETKRNGYYRAQVTDWLELHLLLREAEPLLDDGSAASK